MTGGQKEAQTGGVRSLDLGLGLERAGGGRRPCHDLLEKGGLWPRPFGLLSLLQ